MGTHQSGHNSGVLHSGIYYVPGSLKATNCRDGKLAMQEFCAQHDIRFEICGKVIVATEPAELESLENIYQRGVANGVVCEVVDAQRLAELEPHAAGIRAIHVPEAGIVDFRQVCQRLAELVVQLGHRVLSEHQVVGIRPTRPAVVSTTQGEFETGLVVNCAGLHCDRIASLCGIKLPARIVPFRGEYYQLSDGSKHLCRNLIYPVPDPRFPFLGVHFTRMINGQVECGPNAVLALRREGYRWRDLNMPELWQSLRYPGFWRLVAKHWKTASGEVWRSISKAAFVRALQRLVPDVKAEQLFPAHAGVRAQAVLPDGRLVDDFLIVETENMLHVNNAPSPAATASLNIGKLIVDMLAKRWE